MRHLLPITLFTLHSLACREERSPISAATSASAKPAKVASAAPVTPSRQAVTIQTYGELRAMMHEGKTDGVVTLSRVQTPNAYALGALSGLRGEVTILKGSAWLAYPGEGDATRVEVVPSSPETAALLVAADVATWVDIPVAGDIPWASIDQDVEALAKQAGVDVEQPFPLLIEGELFDLKWHVIDGRRATPGPSSHAQHMQMAAKGTSTATRGTLLGFFSKQHQGIFTHHGDNTHFHFVDTENKLTGHVDAVSIRKGAILKVPQ